MKKVAIIISPNYKDYAEKYLADCVKSLRRQDYQGEMKIFITDNETSPESFEFLNKIFAEKLAKARQKFEIEIIRNKNNDGFAKGNNDAMKLAIKQGFDYIVLFNMDTVVESDCVSELVKVAESGENIGAAQARLMLWPDKEKVNSLGNATHFLGFGYCEGYNEYWNSHPLPTSPSGRGRDSHLLDIFYPSGAAVLFKREVLEAISPLPPLAKGGNSEGEREFFDEEFWMYNEDQDLGWRIWLAGWKCVLAPDAVVYHKYQFAKSIKQYYWMDRNRIIAMIKNYHFLTLLLILPPFVIMELGLILFSLKTGWFKEKIKVWKYFLTPAKWKYLHNARKRTQSLRKIKDRDIAKMITGKIWYQEVDDVKLRLVNPLFEFYWRLVKMIIKW
ncbi:glycosyltransferase family 2 protein [Patescibacteria group bacterium]|nr:glycosyltransferase family 2 protein [Patescibacteria group bacterium]